MVTENVQMGLNAVICLDKAIEITNQDLTMGTSTEKEDQLDKEC